MPAKEAQPPFTVGLVQINNTFSGENYLPLSVGILQAYAQRHLDQSDDFNFLLPIYRRVPVQVAVDQLIGADIAFFSTYVWNYRISLEVARVLKDQSPETIIAFGGPHVPDRVDDFIRHNQFIDLACHGEGEQIALDILRALGSKHWDNIPGISFLNDDGSLVSNPKGPRLKDLDSVPSPYLEGVFTPLIEANPEESWIAMWETNRGCPFSCSFCDWGSAVQAKVHSFELERLHQEAQWFAEHKIEYLFCCDANFGILPRDVEIAQYLADTREKYGYPHAVSVQNTKNATERAYQVQKILAEAGLNKGVDIALQSIDTNTLESIKRANISSDTYQELQRRFVKDGIETCTEMIVGLPGETYESFVDGASTIIGNGQHGQMQFHNLSILPNSEMGDPEYQTKHGLVTVESKVMSRHGTLDESVDDIFETQILVISTNTMPGQDWMKARAFSWMAGLFHFGKTLQIPLILVHEVCSISYRDLLEEFLDGSLESFPVLNEIRSFFLNRAQDIQNGGPELVRSEDHLNIWWPPQEYMLITLCMEDKLGQFYREAEELLSCMVEKTSSTLPADMLHDAVELNRAMFKLPFQTEDLAVDLSYNIWEFYRSCLEGEPIELQMQTTSYQIDRTSETWDSWDDWCREVIWYGNKRGAYMYGNDAVEPQIAGHY